MVIFHYDPVTGELSHAGDAEMDPLDPTRAVVPAFATKVQPPTIGIDRAVVWVDDHWETKIDRRGTYYWDADGTEHRILDIGEEIPHDALLDKPVPPVTEQDVHDERRRRIDGDRAFTLSTGETVVLSGRADEAQVLQGFAFAAQMKQASGVTTPVTFYDVRGEAHTLLPDQIVELWSLGSAYISDVIAAAWSLLSGPIPDTFKDDVHWP